MFPQSNQMQKLTEKEKFDALSTKGVQDSTFFENYKEEVKDFIYKNKYEKGDEKYNTLPVLSTKMRDSKYLADITVNKNVAIVRENFEAIARLNKDPSIDESTRKSLTQFFSDASPEVVNKLKRRQNAFMQRQNATTTSTSGLQQPTTTLTYIAAELIEQLIPQEDWSKHFYTDNQFGWNEEWFFMSQRPVAMNDISETRMEGSNYQSLKNYNTEFSKISGPISTYAFNTSTNLIIQQQGAIMKRDVLADSIRAVTAGWNNAKAKALISGPSDGSFYGLLNNPDVTTDSTTFNGLYYSENDPTQKTGILATFVSEYFANSDSTMLPNKFIMSAQDVMGFGAPYSPTFPTTYSTGGSIESGIDIVQKYFNQVAAQIGSRGIEVIASIFVDKSVNGQKTQYVLYNDDKSNVRLINPIPLTVNAKMSYDGFHTNINMYERLGGIVTLRPTSQLQFFIN